jgi:hypothetical protein
VSSLAFGNQLRGATSAAQSVTLTNTGTQPLTVGMITIADSGDYAQSSNCVGPLAPTASCRIDVTFTPLATGSRSGTLSVSTSVGTVPVALSGTGTLPAGTFLLDDFEGGAGTWKSVGGGSAVTQPGVGRAGTRGAVLTGGDGMYADFATQGQLETHTRFCFDVTGSGAGTLAQGRTANGLNMWEIDYDGGRHGLSVYIWDASRARSDFYVNNVVTAGTWSCADVDVDEAAVGHASVSVDGTTIAQVSGNFGGTADYGRALLWNASGTTYVDDVSVTAQ